MIEEKEKKTYLLGSPVTLADVVSIFQELKHLGDSGLLLFQLLHLKRLSTAPCLLVQVLECLFNKLDILDPQLLADDVQITDGIDITLDVDDLSVIEASDDLEDGIHSTNVGKESISQTSTSRGTTGQTGNIIHGQVGGNLRLGLVVFAKPVEPLIRHDDTSLFRIDRGIGEVGRVTQRRLGDGLEERRLANVGQTDLIKRHC
jgi:hypothetical protein